MQNPKAYQVDRLTDDEMLGRIFNASREREAEPQRRPASKRVKRDTRRQAIALKRAWIDG